MNDQRTPSIVHKVPSGQASASAFTLPVKGSATNGTVAPSSERPSPNQQARRLQLRNAGFRGQTLPIRRISPILSSSILSSETFCRVGSNENSPQNLEKRQLYGEDLPLSPVNILQELHNSARQKRHPSRQGIGEIFQDSTATSAGDGDCALSSYSEANSDSSLLQTREFSGKITGLREVSSKSQTPPMSASPSVRQAKVGKGSRSHKRSTSAEAAKYIEHLESQLVAVNTKLDTLTSPTAHKARAAKLRALTSETRSLRQQVSDWEQNFDEKVRYERTQLAEVEMSLTSRLRTLEDDLEIRDNRVRDLEWEVANLRNRVKDAEGLEAVNTDLERRIDVLTNLLVESPTKLDICSATSSPSKPGPQRCTARPRSMMPRIPPSPGSRLSLNTSFDVYTRQSRRSFASASSISPSADVTAPLFPDGEKAQATGGLRESKEPSDPTSGNSSYRSPPSSSSRPTSLYSTGSFGAYSWGLPLPTDADVQNHTNHKQRRMRRFPPGAAALKPLILPTAAKTPSLPTSPPARNISETSIQRNFSDASLDPTLAFLSRYDFSSPVTTPTQPSRNRSASYVRAETLHALEGRSSTSSNREDDHPVVSPRSMFDEPLETVEEELVEEKFTKRERPRSLGEELAEVDLLFGSPFDDGLIPHEDRSKEHEIPTKVTETGSDASELYPTSPKATTTETKQSMMTAEVQVVPLKPASPSIRWDTDTATNMSYAYGLFSRLKSLILRTKQDPLALARRLICNAWAIGMAKLGGLGWWLLGLVYRHRWRRKERAADVETIVEEIPARTKEWHHFSSKTHHSGFNGRPDQGLHPLDDCQIKKPLDVSLGSLKPRDHGQRDRVPPNGRDEPHIFPCPDCVEPSSRRSLRLWFRFSLAIILAVGIAIKDGPGVLLEECPVADGKLCEEGRIAPQKTQRAPRWVAQNTAPESSHLII
ncbi:MAG: hypothetical protein Q9219_005421 [cf. Caloplaca sp. 3 TL-2023]